VRLRGAWIAGYGVTTVAVVALVGLPERPWVLVWALGLLSVLCWRSENRVARTCMDWLPVLVILAAYDLIRMNAPSLLPRAHVQPQLGFDEFIGFGTAPSVRLQRAFFDARHPGVLDYAFLLVYVSHFFAAIVVGVVVWLRTRDRFARYAWTFLACSLAGFATYVVYPAVPPWMASREGYLPHLARVPDVLWNHLGVDLLAKVFSGDPKYSNPVGAIPSEHAAYPLLFLLLFWAVASPRWRVVLVAYVATMAFVLVYFAEHYVFDELLGYVYAVVAFVVVGRVLDARSTRSNATVPDPERDPAPVTDTTSG